GGGLVAAASAAAAASPAPPPPPRDFAGDFAGDLLRAHNAARARHGAAPLRACAALEREARAWAEHLLERRALKHSDTSHGENLYYRPLGAREQAPGKEVTEHWYSEVKHYDFSSPGYKPKVGYLDKLVWRASQSLGVGRAVSPQGCVVVVAVYDPPALGQRCATPSDDAEMIAVSPVAAPNEMRSRSSTGGTCCPSSGARPALPSHTRGSTSQQKEDQEEFCIDVLAEHNRLREIHGARPLRRSVALGRDARAWARELARSRALRSHPTVPHGQNTVAFAWVRYRMLITAGRKVTNCWYADRLAYDYNNPGFQQGTGNFSQLVWRSSLDLGVGLACDGRGMFVAVAFYSPAGNLPYAMSYRDNVLPPHT
uniref:Golgi-associated plant pathogenesis-related protein 1 n=1 Tax=Petromyzon marinus TaxID=7757 RepID=S4RAI6_PETMA